MIPKGSSCRRRNGKASLARGAFLLAITQTVCGGLRIGASERGFEITSKAPLDLFVRSASIAAAPLMKRSWQILAFLLLALMVPASVCCLGVEVLTEHHCDSCGKTEHQPEAPRLPDCPSDTISHSQTPVSVTMPQMQVIEVTDLIQAMLRLNELAAVSAAPMPLMTTAPPQLRTTWVFASRAALPARAPSALA